MSRIPNADHDIIVVGGSAGAIEALKDLLSRLPGHLPASIFVTIHLTADSPVLLPSILSRSAALPACSPKDHEKIERGAIYVAPPDHDLLIADGRIRLSHGPRENRHRPAIDSMFRSAARVYGPRVIGVILSGELDDGSSGLKAIKMRGGLTVVQDPAEALSPDMPRNAHRYAQADHVLPVAEIAALLAKVAARRLGPGFLEKIMPNETEITEADGEPDEGTRDGKPSAYACPECHGVLWELEEGRLLRYRCRVGHAYTATALNIELSEQTESALWAALRALEEKVGLLRRLGARDGAELRARFDDQASGYEKHAQTLREMLKQSAGRND